MQSSGQCTKTLKIFRSIFLHLVGHFQNGKGYSLFRAREFLCLNYQMGLKISSKIINTTDKPERLDLLCITWMIRIMTLDMFCFFDCLFHCFSTSSSVNLALKLRKCVLKSKTYLIVDSASTMLMETLVKVFIFAFAEPLIFWIQLSFETTFEDHIIQKQLGKSLKL